MPHTHLTLVVALALGCASHRAPAPVTPAPVAVTPVAAAPSQASSEAPVVVTSPSPGWVASSETGAAASPEAARDAVNAAPNVALARVVAAQEECSNLGGMHLRLEVVRSIRGASAQMLAAGGHGVRIPTGMQVVGSTWEVAFTTGDATRVVRGWCVDQLAAVQGVAVALAAPQ